jgi:hypothetical protein
MVSNQACPLLSAQLIPADARIACRIALQTRQFPLVGKAFPSMLICELTARRVQVIEGFGAATE